MVSINNNMGGMRAMDALQQSHGVLQTALERLSTGIRINRAEDDAAGLMVRDRFQAQVNGFEEGIRNIQTASGMVQVAEQALNKVTEALQQMRALAVRAADDNLSDDDRKRVQEQIKGLLREINERAANTAYNGHNLLDGSIADSHEERLGQAKIQSNSFLALGKDLVRSSSTSGTAATTANAISQGSYQVRLVFSGDHGVTPSATTRTTLAGTVNSGPNGDGIADGATVNQVVTDRNGGAHTAAFTFTQTGDGSRSYTYSVTIPAGGVYSSAQSFSGTMSFNADGTIATVDSHPPGDLTRSVTLSDGTAAGQPWTIDFNGLVENQHDVAGPALNATANGGTTGIDSSAAVLGGNLDGGAAVSSTATLTLSYVDNLGTDQTLGLLFTKTTDGANDIWDVSAQNFSLAGSSATVTPDVDFSLANNGGPLTLTISDAYGGTQAISLNVAAMTQASAASSPSVTSITPNAPIGPTSTLSNAPTVLGNTHNISDSVTTAPFTVVDRQGGTHSASITYTMVSTNASGEVWSYQVNGLSGGVWSGNNSGNDSGTLTFNAGGALTAVNGGAPAAFNLNVGDGTGSGQVISVNLNTTSVGAVESLGATANGLSGPPTSAVQLQDNLVSGTSPVSTTIDIVDRTGLDGTTARISFSQVGSSNVWNYTVTAPSNTGFTTFGSGLQGQVEFDAAGNLASLDGGAVLNKLVTLGDGTAEGQAITFDFSQLNMARADNLSDSISDGGQGTNVGEVSAVIYFSDGNGNTDVNPISTLTAVDQDAKTFSAGGVSFTVEKASTVDVGLTAYIKAYTYISATTDDRSLTFQVGPDEGNVTRVGISRMDSDTIFRRNAVDGGTSSYLDIELTNELKAQDLIGQIDDALNFVGGENLKVGTFQNKFTRTLELARQQLTSITGALSNINDADMAKEATNQSKRSILVQSGTAMVAQANSQGQFLLQLLR